MTGSPNVVSDSLSIAANAIGTINASGTYLLFVSSTGPFRFSLDGGPWQQGLAILGIDVSKNPDLVGTKNTSLVIPRFNKVIIQDLSGSQNAIAYVVADAPVQYLNPVPTTYTKAAPTYTKASGVLNLADGGVSAVYNGLDGSKVRKQFAVSNLSVQNQFYLCDGAGNIGLVIPALQSITLETNGSFQLKNIAGSGVSYASIIETFYS